ncbi:hypothetical protein GCM10027168_49950 [Streptomyces capparidis]
MNLLAAALPEFLGGLAAALAAAPVTWALRRVRGGPRRPPPGDTTGA